MVVPEHYILDPSLYRIQGRKATLASKFTVRVFLESPMAVDQTSGSVKPLRPFPRIYQQQSKPSVLACNSEAALGRAGVDLVEPREDMSLRGNVTVISAP